MVLFLKTVLSTWNVLTADYLSKTKTKPFELYYRGWHCAGMGQSFLQSFLYHFMILVQELKMFLFIPWDFTSTLHSMSMKPSGTKWLNTIEWYFAWALGVFRWWLSFIVAWNKEVVWYMLTSQVAFWPEI